MPREAKVEQYQSIPKIVSAYQWGPEIGEGNGVQNKPKKHEMNPDDFFVVNRFKEEIKIQPGDWVIQFPDGAFDVVSPGLFEATYEKSRSKPAGDGPSNPAKESAEQPEKKEDKKSVKKAAKKTAKKRSKAKK